MSWSARIYRRVWWWIRTTGSASGAASSPHEEIAKKLDEYQKERKSQQAPLEEAIKPPVVPLAEFNKLQQQLRELQETLHKENPAAPDLTAEEEEAQISGGKGDKGKAARKSPY